MQQPTEWTIAQAALYEGVTVQTVRRWIQDGLEHRTERNPITGRQVRYIDAKTTGEWAAAARRRHAATKAR